MRLSQYKVRPIRLDFKPSRILICWLGLWVIFAMATLALVPIYIGLKCCGIAILLLHGYVVCQRYVLLQAPSSIVGLEITANHECILRFRNHTQTPVEVLPTSVVLGWCVLLHLRSVTQAKYYVLVLPDSADIEQFRRLRVWLKWGLALDKPAPSNHH